MGRLCSAVHLPASSGFLPLALPPLIATFVFDFHCGAEKPLSHEGFSTVSIA
jgi:hypothetical protein